MRKQAIVLTLIILAIIGGVLASKAKAFSELYCITAVAGPCETSFIGRPTTAITVPEIYYTTTTNAVACPSANCPYTQIERLVPE